jgi:hypothetical protein
MADAVAAEDFERAAALRDEIAVLKGQAGVAEGPIVRQPPPGQMGLGTHVPSSRRPKAGILRKSPTR